jgi:carbon-monoxide dehydrogenase large subunit
MSTVSPAVLAQLKKRYVGARVKRKEDPRLLTGKGQYVDDFKLPNMLHAAFLRSPYAHARIKRIDTSKAEALSGVVKVMTGYEDSRLLHSWMDHPAMKHGPQPPRRSLPTDKVRYVGEPVAVVAAVDRGVAEDAVELIEVEYEPLPPVLNADEALKPDAPLVWEEWGDNIYYYATYKNGDVEKAFAEADVIVKERISSHRYVPTPLEPRAWLVSYDKNTGDLLIRATTQFPHVLRTYISEIFNIPENKIRVIAIDVGGGFGPKSHVYQDEIALVALAIKLGRPIKWVEDRREHLTMFSERDGYHDIEIAVKKDGTILGVRTRAVIDYGISGIFWTEAQPSQLIVVSLPGPYRFQNYAYETIGVVTNKSMTGAHRGFWRPVACLAMERMVDLAAKAIGADPLEMRMKNLVQPNEFPYRCASGVIYDTGNYPEAYRKMLQLSDYYNLRKWQAEMRKQGRFIGIGISNYVEYTAPNSARAKQYLGWKLGTFGSAKIVVHPSGKVTVYTGTAHQGMAHETIFAQIVADYLGVPLDDVSVDEGDTASAPYGWGAWASRSTVTEGGACVKAALKLKEKVLAIAAYRLGVPVEDLVIDEGKIWSKSDPSKSMLFKDVAYIAYRDPTLLPPGVDAGLEVAVTYEPESPTTCSFGIHIAVVEVDPETGKIDILKYFIVEDCGIPVNPMTVEGQIHGALLHGIGGAIYEHLVYDSTGQLLSSTFMDYLIPTTVDGCPKELYIAHLETPSRGLGGFKGMGEGATIAAPAAIMNAVEDALAPFGVKITEGPLSPERVLRYIKEAKAKRG